MIEPGTVSNEIAAHEDMLPTLLAAAGEPNIKEELLQGGVQAIGREYKVHLDGYDLGPALRGEAEWPRKEFIYWTDDGSVAALRYDDWKITFLRQDAARAPTSGTTPSRSSVRRSITNLRMDPFERAERGERDGLPALVHGADVPDRPGRRLRRRMAARASRSSRRGRSRAASTSTASWKRS